MRVYSLSIPCRNNENAMAIAEDYFAHHKIKFIQTRLGEHFVVFNVRDITMARFEQAANDIKHIAMMVEGSDGKV